MDPLSDVLSLLRPSRYASGGLMAGERWALQFPEHEGFKCYALVRGRCVVEVDDMLVELAPGDCVLLTRGSPFRLSSERDVADVVDARTLVVGPRYNGVYRITPGEDTLLVGSHFALDGDGEALLRELPKIVHAQGASEKAAFQSAVTRIHDELRDPQAGGELLVQQAVYTMLVELMRVHLASGNQTGLLRALGDKQVAAALGSIHEDPSRAWTVDELAAKSGMSRTTFAQRFKAMVGQSPVEYLTQLRMRLAGERLRRSTDSIATVARSFGYDSESAFGAAFKRVMGCSPRQYARASAP